MYAHPAAAKAIRASPGRRFSRLRHSSRTEGVNALLPSTTIDPGLPLIGGSERVGLRTAPVEGDVLAGLAIPLEVPSEGFRAVGRRPAPSSDAAAHLVTGRVEELHPLPFRGGGSAQRLRRCLDLTRDRCSPVGQVVGHLKVYGHELDTSYFPDGLGEGCGEAPRLTTEDRLQRLALLLVGLLIEEQTHRRFGLPVPKVTFELCHRDCA